jgi:sec-independent protein translocase protein TatA
VPKSLFLRLPGPSFYFKQGGTREIAPFSAEDLPMGGLSIWHWLVVIVVVMLLFGRGKISDLMGDVAGGIKAFKKGMAEDKPTEPKSEPKTIDHQAAAGAAPKAESEQHTESVRS